MDKAHDQVDNKILTMEKHLSGIYARANKEIAEKANNYFSKFEELDEKKLKQVEEGTLSKAAYKQWRQNKLMTGNHWTQMKNDIAERMLDANETAVAYINNQIPAIYTDNFNYAGNEIESQVKGYSFEMVDEHTIKYLSTTDNTLLPYKVVDGKKDVRWNTQKVNSEVLQGILQGESIPKIAKRLQNVTTMNRESAIRNARTTATSAENKGRMDSYKVAAEKGIVMKKVWLSAHDDRTRAWHLALDRIEKDYDEPFENNYGKIMYPGDLSADPANVYNCRCTLRAKVISVNENKGNSK